MWENETLPEEPVETESDSIVIATLVKRNGHPHGSKNRQKASTNRINSLNICKAFDNFENNIIYIRSTVNKERSPECLNMDYHLDCLQKINIYILYYN